MSNERLVRNAALPEPYYEDGAVRCGDATRVGGRCPFRARFRVDVNDRDRVPFAERVCGHHVRAYLMDNGDSVRPPWIVVAL